MASILCIAFSLFVPESVLFFLLARHIDSTLGYVCFAIYCVHKLIKDYFEFRRDCKK